MYQSCMKKKLKVVAKVITLSIFIALIFNCCDKVSEREPIVYLAGYHERLAVYWKNNVEAKLGNSPNYATGIYVSDNDVTCY